MDLAAVREMLFAGMFQVTRRDSPVKGAITTLYRLLIQKMINICVAEHYLGNNQHLTYLEKGNF